MFLFRLFLLLSISMPFCASLCTANISKNRVGIAVISGYQYYFANYKPQYHPYTWDGSLSTLKRVVSQPNKKIDVLLIDQGIATQACDLGLLLPFSDDILTTETKQCNLLTFTDHIALSWDAKRIHFKPTWKDFWNITQFPGKRGLRKEAFSAMSIALLADGVAYDNVIPTLSTPEGILRAFKKLNQLKPYIVWWSTPSEANFLLKNKQVLMTSASIMSLESFKQQHSTIDFQTQKLNTIESPIVLSLPATISTQRMNILYNQLKVKPLLPFPTEVMKHIIQRQNVNKDQIVVMPKQFSISLDQIFNEWLQLTNQ